MAAIIVVGELFRGAVGRLELVSLEATEKYERMLFRCLT